MNPYYKLAGFSLKSPTSFNIAKYNLTKSGRVASGKVKLKIIARKRKFEFEYTVLSGTDYQIIDDLLYGTGTSEFYTFEYVENGIEKSATVYSGALTADKFRTDGIWYWKNVKFALIEE